MYNDLSNLELLNKIKEYNNDIDIHLNNRKRLIRVLNKYENNEIMSNKKDELLYPIKVIGLTTSRDILYERIDKRVDNMISSGLLDEVNSLKDYYDNSKILNNAIGYKEFKDYFFNNKDLSNVIEEVKHNSRKYAKRQYTFFKHQFNTCWFDVDFNDFNNTIEEVYNYINK